MNDPQPPPRYTFDRVVRMILSAIVLVVVLALLRYLSDVLIPFVVAMVLAYMLNPLVNLFEQRTRRRGAAVAITIGGLGAMGMALFVLILPLVYKQVVRFGNDVELLRRDLAVAFRGSPAPPLTADTATPADFVSAVPPVKKKSLVGWHELIEGWRLYQHAEGPVVRSERFGLLRAKVAGTYIGDLLDGVLRYVNSQDFSERMVDLTKKLAEGGWTVLTFAVNLVLGLTAFVLVLLYLVFLLLDFPDYARDWKSFLPPQYRKPIVEFLGEFDLALRRYLRGQSVVSLLYAAFLSLGFWIIDLPMAVPLGIFIGMLSIVPYLQTMGLIPAGLFAVMRSIEGDYSLMGSLLLTFLIFAGVQMLQDWLITPRIMGKATGLRPVAVLLGVFIWGKLLGFLGLILAIPLTCLGIAYYRRYVLKMAEARTA